MSPSKYRQAARLLEAGKPAQALALCEQIGADAADALDANALAAECLAEIGRWPEADARAAQVLEEDPDWATGYLIRGLACVGSLDHRKAESLLKRALELDGALAEAALTLAVLCDYKGNHRQADRWVEHARQTEPELPPPLHVDAPTLDALLLEVIDQFPEHSADTLDESRIRVVAMPGRSDLERGTAVADPAQLDEVDALGDPPSFAMTLFQRNIERGCRATADIKRELTQALELALAALAEAVKQEEPSGDED